jgi:hypothetical protein
VGIAGRGPVGGGVVAAGVVAVGVSVDVEVSFVSEESAARVALAGRGQSSGVSGYSIGLSAMYSSGRLLWNGVGRFVESISVSEARPWLASESESLYHMVPWASIRIPDRITRGTCSGKSSTGGVSGEALGDVMYAGSSPAICGGSSPGSSAGPSPGSSAMALPASSTGTAPLVR